jgi:hypothetical protein
VKYVFDIDGTVCNNTYGSYEKAYPITGRIEHINNLYEDGNFIVFFTARGMKSLDGNVEKVYQKYYDFTYQQLVRWGVKFHELILGKPSADLYIDDKGVKDEDYFTT